MVEVAFASTPMPISRLRSRIRRAMRSETCPSCKSEVPEGTFLELAESRVSRAATFRHDLHYRDPIELPTVRAPQEGISCLERLAGLAA